MPSGHEIGGVAEAEDRAVTGGDPIALAGGGDSE